MVWIYRECYMTTGLNCSWVIHRIWSELIMSFTKQIVWIDYEFYIVDGVNWSWYLHGRVFTWQMVKFIRNFTRQMVQTNQELIWGKRSELIMNIFRAKVWIEQEFAQSKWSELFMNFYRAKVLNLSWISTEKKGVIWSSVSIGQTVWIDHEFL